MAEVFKNGYLDVTSSAQTIYTAPSAKTAVVVSLRVTNVDGSADETLEFMSYITPSYGQTPDQVKLDAIEL